MSKSDLVSPLKTPLLTKEVFNPVRIVVTQPDFDGRNSQINETKEVFLSNTEATLSMDKRMKMTAPDFPQFKDQSLSSSFNR
jgi:hypothetical protein